MKKSTLFALVSLAMVFLVLNTISRETKVYEKKLNFNTPEEAITNFIGYANAYERVENKNIYYNVVPSEFLESLSRRYRLYIKDNSDRRFLRNYIPTFVSYELEAFDKALAREEYDYTFQGIPNYKRSENVKYYRLRGMPYNSNEILDKTLISENGTINQPEIASIDSSSEAEEMQTSLFLVVVDEGEGYVVDYYSPAYTE